MAWLLIEIWIITTCSYDAALSVPYISIPSLEQNNNYYVHYHYAHHFISFQDTCCHHTNTNQPTVGTKRLIICLSISQLERIKEI